MLYPKLSDEEIIQRGKDLYQNNIRSQVETVENAGKLVSISVETGEYEIGDDLLITSRRLQAKQLDAAIWAERIGYDAVYAIGGSLIKTIE
ncbi:MAG: hypothetical protein KME18_03020 [Phormidium tanganyikae FI6-MK23]|jgi:hypothetical protein|nr:hypothetical protein [Phormidium tanganyikae FI6-MK23]